VPRDRWQTLDLRIEGDRLSVSLDGRELFSATDRTFAEADFAAAMPVSSFESRAGQAAQVQ
jgi:hypothetical protein